MSLLDGLKAVGAAFLLLAPLLFNVQVGHADASCTSGNSMNIVAHTDDDLIFLNPSVQIDIDAGRCVETVYVTASDSGSTQQWSSAREDGERAAYAHMAGVSDTWTTQSLTVNGHTLQESILTGNTNIHLLFMQLPDGNPDGAGFSSNSYQSLAKLWQGTISSISPIDATASYTWPQAVDTLHALMASYKPDTIRTQNYADNYDGGSADHSDHRIVGYLAKEAHSNYTLQHQLIGYRGYDTQSMTANVTGATLTSKQNTYFVYDPFDGGNCSSTSACSEPSLLTWAARNYTVESESRPTWSLDTLDGNSSTPGGTSGTNGITPTSIVFNGSLYSFYYDQTNGELKYAKQASSTSTTLTFGVLDTYGTNVGQNPSAAIFNNQLYLFYYDAANGNLREANSADGSTWTFNDVDTTGNVGLMPAPIVYGGILRAYYYDQTNGNLKQAWLSGSTWNTITLEGDSGAVVPYNANVGLDPTVVIYGTSLQIYSYDATLGDLHHTWYDGSWHQESLDGSATTNNRVNANVGINPTAVIYGSSLQLYYYDNSNGNLRHAWADSVGWHFETLEGDRGSVTRYEGNVGATPFAIVQNSTLHVFAYDVGSARLRHYWTSSTQGWQVETLDGKGDDGSEGRINSDTGEDPVAVIFGTRLQVFTYNRGNTDLRHATL